MTGSLARWPSASARTTSRALETIPIASRNAIARAALRIGLNALEADPSLLFSAKKAKTRRR